MTMHIPEPLFDLRAQATALLDPDACRATMLVTEPRPNFVAPLLELANGARVRLRCAEKDGATLLLNADKLPFAESARTAFLAHGLGNEELMAKLLGYTAPKTELVGLVRVLQVLRHDGAVLWEQLVDQDTHAEAWERGLEFGDDLRIEHTCDVLIRRLQLLKREEGIR